MDKKVLEKLKNKEFVEKIIKFSTKEEVVKAFADENIEISEQDLDCIGRIFNSVTSKITTLSDNDLEEVGGGFIQQVAKSTDNYIKDLGDQINSDLLKDNSEMITDAALAGIIAVAGVGAYKVGKWVTNHKHWYFGTAGIVYDEFTGNKKKK